MFEKLGFGSGKSQSIPRASYGSRRDRSDSENARLKAETIAELTGKTVLADDSGLKVDILGVFTRSLVSSRLRELVRQMRKTMRNCCTNWPWSLTERSFGPVPYDLGGCKTGQGKLSGGKHWPGYINLSFSGNTALAMTLSSSWGNGPCAAAELTLEEKYTITSCAFLVEQKVIGGIYHGSNNHRYE